MAGSEDIEALYRRFGPMVYRRCLSLLGSQAEAQDCLQDTFLGYLKLAKRGEAQPLTILLRIATFQAVDRVRKKARWFGRVTSCAVREDEADDTLDAQATAWSRQQGAVSDLERSELLQDLAVLTRGEDEETIAAATMHWVEGYTLEETASSLGVTRKTAAARLNRLMERAQARAKAGVV